MSIDPKLVKIRAEIDEIDQQILTLINARADCAMRVAQVKQAQMVSTGEVPVYYRPEREAQVLAGDGTKQRTIAERRLPVSSARLCPGVSDRATTSRRLFGTTGTSTEVAALKHFGHAWWTHVR